MPHPSPRVTLQNMPLGPFTRFPRRRRARPDVGQAAIVAALRTVGCSVEILADVGRGVPDLLAGIRGTNFLLEVKSPRGGRGKRGLGSGKTAHQVELNATEQKWHAAWRGQVSVVRSVEDALAVVRGNFRRLDRAIEKMILGGTSATGDLSLGAAIAPVRSVDARLVTFHRDLDALEADVAAEVARGDAAGKKKKQRRKITLDPAPGSK